MLDLVLALVSSLPAGSDALVYRVAIVLDQILVCLMLGLLGVKKRFLVYEKYHLVLAWKDNMWPRYWHVEDGHCAG